VAHACNPGYSGGRVQENLSSKPAQANSSQDPISKKPFTKIGLVEWLKVKALSSSLSTIKKHKTNKKLVVRKMDGSRPAWPHSEILSSKQT
jgi:hypothetical protein